MKKTYLDEPILVEGRLIFTKEEYAEYLLGVEKKKRIMEKIILPIAKCVGAFIGLRLFYWIVVGV
jgi:hypothetical protein